MDMNNQKGKSKKVPGERAAATCSYGGQTYSEGATTCQNDDLYTCQADGTWEPTRLSCD